MPQPPPKLPFLDPLEGLPQAIEDMWVVLGCRELAGVYSLGMQRIGQHGFPCILWHPSPLRSGRSRQFSIVSLRGRRTRSSREFPARAHFCSSHSCVWVQCCHHGPPRDCPFWDPNPPPPTPK